MTIIYGAAAVLSALLLIGCCLLVRKKRAWFILLFSSVLVVNIGYIFLSLSTCLEAFTAWKQHQDSQAQKNEY